MLKVWPKSPFTATGLENSIFDCDVNVIYYPLESNCILISCNIKRVNYSHSLGGMYLTKQRKPIGLWLMLNESRVLKTSITW